MVSHQSYLLEDEAEGFFFRNSRQPLTLKI